MFERFTEKARRVFFFARYEASLLGSPDIEPEHLLLGLLREWPFVRAMLKSGAAEDLREELREKHGERQQVSTSVDLPLSLDAKRMLAYAAEESQRHDVKEIDCGVLFLGLLRLESTIAHEFLKKQAGDLTELAAKVEELVGQGESGSIRRVRPRTSPNAWVPDLLKGAPTGAFAVIYKSLANLVERTSELVDDRSETYGNTKLRRRPLSRKEALGQLIDAADQHRLWLARAMTEPSLRVDLRANDEWAAAQRYGELPWAFLVECWLSANCLLLRTIAVLPDAKANLPCRIGIEEPTTLEKLLTGFVEFSEDIMEQILAHL